MLVRTLKWPFIGVFIAGALHTLVEAVWPDLQTFYTPSVLGVIQFGFGIVAGYLAVRNGGNFLTAALYGALLGLFPLVVQPINFGLMLGRGLDAGILSGVFGFSMMTFGSLVAGALAAGMNASKK